MALIAVEGDLSTHGAGELIAAGASSPQKVSINGKAIIVHESPAQPDTLGHPQPPTATAGGSAKVTCYGSPIHRHGDPRQCGATTISIGQTKVTAG